ncbi:MAG: KUP/HAK/KT family potassium transporter [Bacteroidota bacterium]
MSNKKNSGGGHLHKITFAGLLVTLGIIYGDIGTSPLYVFKAIIGEEILYENLILGGISCVFWTLTLQTSIKYVLITLQADNRGEGGIFSLFSLVRRKAKWLIIPAMIGGATLLADGIITPPISVCSAIEGLKVVMPKITENQIVNIVIIIISLLFLIQQFGTKIIGRLFGPVMLIWFSMLAALGIMQILQNPIVLKAINPYYAFVLLRDNPIGLGILGAVFLCTTGAEALYSDLGHCGKNNIRVTWIFVKAALILNYMGQGAFLLKHLNTVFTENPFYAIMPKWFLFPGIVIATLATIIASQALITGSFTLISEAMRLNLWPKVKINYPSEEKGQIYAPAINWLLLLGCIVVVLYFRNSGSMEHAYGLSITLTMLMTTILVSVFLISRKVNKLFVLVFTIVFLLIESIFLMGNLSKIFDGGWFTLLVGSLLFSVMLVWYRARKIKNRYVRFNQIEDYYTLLTDLSKDETVPKYASNLVYLTSANYNTEIEAKTLYSIINQKPKRADTYWLVHVDTLDTAYNREYKVESLIPGILYRIELKLGFREQPRVNFLFHEVIEEMVKNNEIDILSKHPSLRKHNVTGDFRFIVIEKTLSDPFQLSLIDRATMYYYFFFKKFALSEEKAFGLDHSHVTVETVPLILSHEEDIELKRIS